MSVGTGEKVEQKRFNPAKGDKVLLDTNTAILQNLQYIYPSIHIISLSPEVPIFKHLSVLTYVSYGDMTRHYLIADGI